MALYALIALADLGNSCFKITMLRISMKRDIKKDIAERLNYSSSELRVICEPYYLQVSDEDFFTKAIELAKEVASCENDFNIFFTYYTTAKTIRSIKDVRELAKRAGSLNPWCKKPD